MQTSTAHLVARGLVILLVSCCSLAARAQQFAGGTGAVYDPYQIRTADQLISIGSDPNLLDKHFVLLNDIDLDPDQPGGRVFTRAVIAPGSEGRQSAAWKGVPFSGTFDGRGHSVRNPMFQKGDLSFIGLFGCVAKGAVVSDLRVVDAYLDQQSNAYQGVLAAWNEGQIARCGATGHIAGNAYAGLLAGFNRGEIIDCWAQGEVSGAGPVGGLVGLNSYGAIVNSHAACGVLITYGGDFSEGGGLVGESLAGEIVNCWAGSDVSGAWGSNRLGGLVGLTCDALIADSYATGNVSVESGGYGLGGLVGIGSGTINDCYATGKVSGGDYSSSVGGLVGSVSGFIFDCYAVGQISGGWLSEDIGGLAGHASSVEVKGCFWNIETSSQADSAAGAGLTTAQMQDRSTYLAAGWDLAGERTNGTADLWLIPDDKGYPSLTVHSETFQPHELAGDGTPEDPYQIATIEDLDAINHYDLGACYRLQEDIDLSGSPRERPIVRYFAGRFDGARRFITGLTIRGPDHLGLFGGLGVSAAVTDLGIYDADVAGDGYVGVLAGTSRGSITTCRAGGTVTGKSALGVLTGWTEGVVSDSYAIGRVSSDLDPTVGGLTGWNIGALRRCYAAARVLWSKPVAHTPGHPGGLVGSNHEPSDSGVISTRNLAELTGEITDCYFLIDADGGGPDNGLGTPLTNTGMKQKASFLNWDFDDVWTIREGQDYPRLRWEGTEQSERSILVTAGNSAVGPGPDFPRKSVTRRQGRGLNVTDRWETRNPASRQRCVAGGGRLAKTHFRLSGITCLGRWANAGGRPSGGRPDCPAERRISA
jgi:hypothetical protein